MASSATANWVEMSDSYIKLVFVCPECHAETVIPLDEFREVGDPICLNCGIEETRMEYKTVMVYM